jgi:DNA-binding NtrC family response regulator
MPISIPPLRQRKGEIPGLVTRLLTDGAAKFGRPVPQVSPDAMAKLTSFDWPGNVRELASVLERAMLFSAGEISAAHVELSRGPSMRPSAPPPPRPEPRGVDAAPSSSPASVPPPPSVPRPLPTKKTLAEDVTEVERRRILEALEQCAGNQVRAAELLGVSRRTLINRMIAYAIPRPRKG